MIINSMVAFAVSFGAVFFKVVQQKNVGNDNYFWMIPTSMFMALSQVLIIFLTVQESVWVFIPMGLGGGLACIIATKFYNKFF